MTALLNWLVLILHVVAATVSAGHALLYKRDPRAALGWIGVCVLFPLAGPVLYYLFGINRIRTRARRLTGRPRLSLKVGYERPLSADQPKPTASHALDAQYRALSSISDAVSRRPLVSNNEVTLLHNGEQAYPAMLEAIDGAAHSLSLATYLWETNTSGRSFIDAVARAAQRGVEVRVLVDGVGELYSIPRVSRMLQQAGVRVARFLPPRLWPPSVQINLRNHRKILVADGKIAFAGGMNLGDRHLASDFQNPNRVVDTQCRLRGPVVAQIEQAFAEDWEFASGEAFTPMFADVMHSGSALCRVITDGPNEDLDSLSAILLAALSAAKKQIMVMTPYFVPSREMISAFQSASLRGVEVTIILPEQNNLPYVHWATRNLLWELLLYGVRVLYQPPPFVHTKLLVIDGHYAHIGSANWDARSLRLNFELVVEVYDTTFAKSLLEHLNEALDQAHAVSLAELDGRSLPVRVRDAGCWLFSPYL